MNVLSLNCGSSSIKFQLMNWESRMPFIRGILERVGIEGSFCRYEFVDKTDTHTIQESCPTHKEGLELIIRIIQRHLGMGHEKVNAVGHRVVHGGEKYAAPILISQHVLTELKNLSYLAPLHNPPSILGIEAAMDLLPEIPQVAVMDTAWHQTMPPHVYHYALPYSWYEKYGIRRYGFHGISYLYVSRRAAVILNKKPEDINLIVFHLGNGSSVNAIKRGKSYDTSMGFTPLEGLVMGTRAGNHDVAIDFYLMEREGLSVGEIYNILNKKSGILGITGEFTDRRDVIRAAKDGNRRAKLALEIEGYAIKKYIGAYYAALGELDAIIFTGGVGEMEDQVREKGLSDLDHLGIKYDPVKNRLSKTRSWETDITAPDSRVKILVIPTNEEIVIAEDVANLLTRKERQSGNSRYQFEDPAYENPLRKRDFLRELAKNSELLEIAAYKPKN